MSTHNDTCGPKYLRTRTYETVLLVRGTHSPTTGISEVTNKREESPYSMFVNIQDWTPNCTVPATVVAMTYVPSERGWQKNSKKY